MSEPTAPDPDRKIPASIPPEVESRIRQRIEGVLKDIVPQPQQRGAVDKILPEVLKGVSATAVVMQQTVHQGPLPRAEELARYNDAHPGTAERIVRMAERDQEYFIEANKDQRRRDDRYRLLGLAAGFIAFLVMLGVALYLAVNGHDVAAGGVLAVGIAGIISTFVNGRNPFHPSGDTPADDQN